MADVAGVKIIDLTAAGSSDDGEHVWITHRLGDGSEYPLVYPYEAVGYLITVLTDAARSASRRRIAQNPTEAGEGLNTEVIPVEEARVGTSPEMSGATATGGASGSRRLSFTMIRSRTRVRRTVGL